LIENQDYVVKQAAIWIDFRQQLVVQEVENNLIFQQIDASYQQEIAELLDLQDPQLAKFIWTLVDGISINQLESEDSFTYQIELLTQMLIAYFEKHF